MRLRYVPHDARTRLRCKPVALTNMHIIAAHDSATRDGNLSARIALYEVPPMTNTHALASVTLFLSAFDDMARQDAPAQYDNCGYVVLGGAYGRMRSIKTSFTHLPIARTEPSGA